jgi:hypothetical protein
VIAVITPGVRLVSRSVGRSGEVAHPPLAVLEHNGGAT